MDAGHLDSPAKASRPKVAIRREGEPPRNADGQICCEHAACKGKTVVFRRPCEWNKHMDRHERPYKCDAPECSKMPTFTYSGGLLRHQREVHKMHRPPKLLMCPYTDCSRSVGNGFTRQENLKERIRRLHHGRHAQETPAPSDSSVPSKRPINKEIEALRDELADLHKQIRHKSARLQELESQTRHSLPATPALSSEA